MHPFGGTQRCPRCDKAVYAAEQAMGPGRKLYHKPCLACTICNKRLDSFTLLEHDEKPYCKTCHVKNFGTRDLRQANLPVAPYREDPASQSGSPPASPTRGNGFATPPPRVASPVRVSNTGGGYGNGAFSAPRLRPNRSLATSPISSSFPRPEIDTALADDKAAEAAEGDADFDAGEERDTVDWSTPQASPFPKSRPPALTAVYTGTPTNTGRPGHGGIPRTVPLSPTRTGSYGTRPRHIPSRSVGSIGAAQGMMDNNGLAGAISAEGNDADQHEVASNVIRPLVPSATGTRYGAALGGGVAVQMTGGGSPRKWGTGTPSCPRCGRSVYFAEQVKAVGKTFHKNCLRCVECNTSLDSSRLRDHDGEPLCTRCYSKLHGPQGSGYALLGKAGG